MRKGKIDPMIFIFAGAAVGCLLMFTCYRLVSSTLMPSMAMTGAASAQFGTTVNVTDTRGLIAVMITDTTTAADDTTAMATRAKEVARWVLANRKDTTAVRSLTVSTIRPQEGTIMPKQVHQLKLRAADVQALGAPSSGSTDSASSEGRQ